MKRCYCSPCWKTRSELSSIHEGSTLLRPADLDGWYGMFPVRHSDYDGCGSALDSHQTSPEPGTMKLWVNSSKVGVSDRYLMGWRDPECRLG